jgi:putative oxidoreductase
MKREPLIALITYALFFLFIYTSLNKLMAYDYYLYDLKRSPLLGSYALLISIIVPGLELIIAGLLLINRNKGMLASSILMIIFTLYVIYVLLFAKEQPCTCGGIIRQLTWPQHLVFNICFLLLAIIGYRGSRKP